MQRMQKIAKKIVSWGTVSTTIAWSIGLASFAAPLAANAQLSLAAGTLVKGESHSGVYYYAANGSRYTFPNEAVYFSWYPDFAGVQLISDADLATLPLGGNVVMRAGTFLVKITTDPKTYAVEPNGVLRHVTSATVAQQLWGDAWASYVRDVDDSVFPNYSLGADLTTAAYHTGSLVIQSGSPDVFYIDGSSKRHVTGTGFTANNFQWQFVHTTSVDLSGLTLGTDLSVGDPVMVDASQGGGAGTITPTGTGLTVATASDTPAAATIVTDSGTSGVAQALIGGVKIHLTASSDGDVIVSGVKVNRGGISADADLQEIYLYEGNAIDAYIASSNSLADGVITFASSAAGGLITVPAGGSKDLMVRFDLAQGVSAGKTISFSVDAANVTAGSASVSGSAAGNTFTIASVGDLGYLELANVNPTAASDVDPQTDFELWRFKADANDQDMLLKNLRLTLVGSVDLDDIQNFRLLDGATELGTQAMLGTGGILDFDFSSLTDGGLLIASGVSKNLSLRGDILGGTNRTFRLTIRESSDAMAWDTSYNVWTRPRIDGGTGWSVIQAGGGTAVDYTISTGKLTIQRSGDSPNTNVPDSATNVLLAKFDFTAAGEDVKITSMTMTCSSSDTALILTNEKLIFDGAQVGTTGSTLTCDGGTDDTAFTFGNSFIVPAGSTRVLEVKGDLTSSTVDADDTILISFDAGSSNAEGRVSLSAISTSSVTASTVTVKGGAVIVSEDAGLADRTGSNPTGVLGAQGVTLAQFKVTGGGEAADITQVVLTEGVSGGGTVDTLADFVQNLKLWHNGTQIGTTFGTLTDTDLTTFAFTPSTPITVAAGGSEVFQVTGDLRSTLGTSAALADVNTDTSGIVYPSRVSATGVTTASDVSDTDGATSMQNVFINTNGNLSVYPDSATPIAQTYILGQTDQELARFKFEADVNEDIIITRLVISDFMSDAGGVNGATGTLSQLSLVDAADGTVYGATVSSMDSSSTGSSFAPVAIFDNILNLTISRSGSKTLKVMTDLTAWPSATSSSSTHRLAVLPNWMDLATYDAEEGTSSRGITASGKDSGWSISSTSLDFNASATNSDTDVITEGSTHRVYRSKITVALGSGTPTGTQTPGVGNVAEFVVTNTSPGDFTATLQLMNLDIATSISNTAARTINIYHDSVTAANLLATTSPTGNFIDTELADSAFDNPSDIESYISTSGGTGSRTYIVQADTTDGSVTDTQTLRVGLDTGDILWGDGATTGIHLVDSLPVTGNTLSY